MIDGIIRFNRLRDMPMIPIVVSPSMTPFSVAQTLLRKEEELRGCELSEYVGKLRILYSDLIATKHEFQFIHPDGYFIETRLRRMSEDDCVSWCFNEETRKMLTLIHRIVPISDVDTIPYFLTREVPECDLPGHQLEVVDFFKSLGVCDDALVKISVHQPQPNTSFKFFFTSGDKLVEVITEYGMSPVELTERIKHVRDWCLLQKLSY
jgi:hypothetical protein